ncbi:MAG: flavodoxin family protein [Desulfurococcaceae archaeon]
MLTPKILVLNGSPRKYGSSSQLAGIVMKGILDAGGIGEEIFLYDYDIKPCKGCVSDGNKYCKFPCVINDDFNQIGMKILSSDGLVITTPVYWYAPSGVLKNFIDRLTSMEHMIFKAGRSLLEGKVAGFVVTGLDSGVMMTISYLITVFNSMGVHIIPWSMAYSHLEDVSVDEQALRDAYNVGYIAVLTAKALKSFGQHIGYRPDVDIKVLAEIARKRYLDNIDKREERIRGFESLF